MLFEFFLVIAIGLMIAAIAILIKSDNEDKRKEEERQERIKRLENRLLSALKFLKVNIFEKETEDEQRVFYFNFQRNRIDFHIDQNDKDQNVLVVDIRSQLTTLTFIIINEAEIDLGVKNALRYIAGSFE